jgi:hypothetical protein
MTQILRRNGLTALLALITALGLAACGSSSGGSSSSAVGSSGGDSASAQQALQAAYAGVTEQPPTQAT